MTKNCNIGQVIGGGNFFVGKGSLNPGTKYIVRLISTHTASGAIVTKESNFDTTLSSVVAVIGPVGSEVTPAVFQLGSG